MKKIVVLYLFILISASYCYSQKTAEISFLMEGKCHKVLNHLIKQLENDSLAVAYFFDNYKVLNNPIKRSKRNDFKYVINEFNKLANKDYFCIRKTEYYNRTLLIDTNSTQ